MKMDIKSDSYNPFYVDSHYKFSPDYKGPFIYSGNSLSSSTIDNDKDKSTKKEVDYKIEDTVAENPAVSTSFSTLGNPFLTSSKDIAATPYIKEFTAITKVSFVEAFSSYWKRYTDFGGETTRREYFLALLGVTLVFLSLFLVLVVFSVYAYFESYVKGGGSSSEWSGYGVLISFILLNLFFYVTIIPSFSISVRRLRDAGLSPFWVFLFITPITSVLFIPLVFFPSAEKNARGVIGKMPPNSSTT